MDSLNINTNESKCDIIHTFLSTRLGQVLSQWLRFLLEVQKHPSPLDSAPVEAGLPQMKSCVVENLLLQQRDVNSNSKHTLLYTMKLNNSS